MDVRSVVLLLACIVLAHPAAAKGPDYSAQRREMIQTIEAHAKADIRALGSAGLSENVLAVMAQTERQLFVPESYRLFAYADRAVPIGSGQAIPQPYMIALMTHLADLKPHDTVLEVGTGSGYQAAILAQLVRTVCTIEVIRPLGEAAAQMFEVLGFDNIRVRIGDGHKGWPECGPFDAVLVTAALGHVPPPLIEQLKPGGLLVMPVGPAGAAQALTVVEKRKGGKTKTRNVGPFHFVPPTRH